MRSLKNFAHDQFRSLTSGLASRPLKRDMRSLFVLSTGRTGSTALARLLEQSRGIKAGHELTPCLFSLRRTIYDSGDFEDPSIAVEIFRGERLSTYNRAAQEGKLMADTSPFLSFFVSILAKALPNSQFIFMHRRPEDFVRSGMRRAWYQNHPNDPVRLSPRPETDERENWRRWSRFEKICWLWAEYNRVCLVLYEQLPPSRRMTLPCAEFWGNSLESAAGLAHFLRVPMISEEMVVKVMRTPANAQISGDFPEAGEWGETQRKQMKRIAGDTMEKLGYA